ncbi:MAG: hypothetical protein V1826_01070 [bacterium]
MRILQWTLSIMGLGKTQQPAYIRRAQFIWKRMQRCHKATLGKWHLEIGKAPGGKFRPGVSGEEQEVGLISGSLVLGFYKSWDLGNSGLNSPDRTIRLDQGLEVLERLEDDFLKSLQEELMKTYPKVDVMGIGLTVCGLANTCKAALATMSPVRR